MRVNVDLIESSGIRCCSVLDRVTYAYMLVDILASGRG